MTISIVIPAFNCSGSLKSVVTSILASGLCPLEILIVNDGSSDDTGVIAKQLESSFDGVRVIDQPNKGVSAARNRGIHEAVGNYVFFVDADDSLVPDSLSDVNEIIDREHPDMVLFGMCFDYYTHGRIYRSDTLSYPTSGIMEPAEWGKNFEALYACNMLSPVWNKLIRRQFMLDEQISFQAQQHINDVLASLLVLSLAKRITICNKRLVYYRMNRGGSLMSSYGEKIDSVMTAYEETYRRLRERGLTQDPQIRQSIIDKAVGVYYFTMPYVDNVDQYRAYFARMTEGDQFLKLGSDNINSNYNMSRYLAMQGMDADSFLFAEYQRLTRQVDEKKQEIAALKKDLKKISREREKLTLKNAGLKESLKQQKGLLKESQKREAALERERGQLQKKLDLKSVRMALAASRALGKLGKH